MTATDIDADLDELAVMPFTAAVEADASRDRVRLLLASVPELLPHAWTAIEFVDLALPFAEREAIACNIARRLNRCSDRLLPRP